MGYDLFIIVTLPLLWLALNVFSFIIIFFYQLGHASPALIFTKKPVNIYIGTFGDNNGKRLHIGRLNIVIKPKFAYLKQNGLCIYDTNMSFSNHLITLLGGPVLLLVLIGFLIIFTCFTDLNVYARIVLGVALLVATANLLINLFPRKLLVKSSKRLHYSDGYQLILIMEDKSNYTNMMNACLLYDEADYENALIYLNKIDDKYMEESLFSMMLSGYIQLKRFEPVKELQAKYKNAKWQESVTADEYFLFGYAEMQLKHYTEALVAFDKAISIKPDHYDSRKGRAFVYNALKDYNIAKEDATRAIFIRDNSSEAFSTRAYANFMLGKPGEAFTDADKALTLDEANPYAHLVMGMYLLDKGKAEKAKMHFDSAKQLKPDMLYIDEQLAKIAPHNSPAEVKSPKKRKSN